MFLNRAAMVCLAIASVAAAQVSPPTPPRASRGHSVATGVLTKRGFLGVGIMDLTEERAKSLKLTDASGVVVRRVDENSPAARAGLRENDVITEVNGQKVDDGEDFIRMIGEISPGNKVSLTLWRDGVKQSVSATLQARPAQAFVLPDDFPAMPAMPSIPEMPNGPWGSFPGIQSPRVGFEGETLTAQLAAYFGVKEGVLVRSVTANTPAMKAGLRAGDVVTKVNGTPVTSTREISGLVRASRKAVTFTVMRNHKEMTLDIEIARNARPAPQTAL